MAITSYDLPCNKPPKSLCSTNSVRNGAVPCRFVKVSFSTDQSTTSAASKSTKPKKTNSTSPYLANDKVQLLSRVTEKRLMHKKTTDFVSSFPMAVNLYKANSDELNTLRRGNKKVKKSVLTLPNCPAPLPQTGTVSDMNDSEYKDDPRKLKAKKRIFQTSKKSRVRNKDFEFYDRDARYCSQLNIDLDCSSTDMINYNGDNKGVLNGNKSKSGKLHDDDNELKAHDVWAVLRNINRFQFRPSPPMSEDSIVCPKKQKGPKRRNNRKDTRVIETCHTEEFAYISSYELEEGKSLNTFSQSSSFDRITVIDKQDDFSQIFEKNIHNSNDLLKGSQSSKQPNQMRRINQRKITKRSNVKLLRNTGRKVNNKGLKKTSSTLKIDDDQPKIKNKQNNNENTDDSAFISDQENSQLLNQSDVTSCCTSKRYGNLTTEDRNDVVASTSDLSGSSKAEIEDGIHGSKKKLLLKVSSDESGPHFKGISKVVLSKGREPVVAKTYEIPKRKPRLVTTMLSTTITPKLTQADIKRRLANIKFPLVIMDKEEVSSQIHVVNTDIPQFYGLDEHIWPFMIEWDDSYKLKNTIITTEVETGTRVPSKRYNPEPKPTNLNRNNNAVVTNNKQLGHYERKQANAGPILIKKKIEIKDAFQEVKRQKPILQLKDKMLNLLYKKSSNRNINHVNIQNDSIVSPLVPVTKVDASTDTHAQNYDSQMRDTRDKRKSLCSPIKSPPAKRPQNELKQRWAKAKWASDFIENVIKKIKSGVYYTQDSKRANRNYRSGSNEISVQTTLQIAPEDYSFEQYTAPNTGDPLKVMSEYDNALSAIEITTLNSNEIAIKHCVTNVTLQFDVTIPGETTPIIMNAKTSSSLIPVDVTESKTKIFKCKTTIINAILPAELCSIMPKMLHSLIDSNMNLPMVTYSSIVVDKTSSHLSTIAETRSESPDILKSMTISFHMSHEVKKLLQGLFSTEILGFFKYSERNKVIRKVAYNYDRIGELLPKITLKHLLFCEAIPVMTTVYIAKQKQTRNECTDISTYNRNRISTALEPYDGTKKNVHLAFKRYNFMSIIENMIKSQNFNVYLNSISCINEMRVLYNGKDVTVNMTMQNKKGLDKNMSVTVRNIDMTSLFKSGSNGRTEYLNENSTALKSITSSNRSPKKGESSQSLVVNSKCRRQGFFRLYRKCKSTTNISTGERGSNLSLNKIINLEDFFQILGSKKWLSSVFDGSSAKKILSSIIQMKNWITEINPRQALLVLLLTNKKDTPNLVRFRPILLQGIAVNRITRASELDMEIEVIETENFDKFSQYDGISYLPSCVENNDILLEELYWIAKTTASDYQKPFDESSVRLLKSLLEKRKKLNPSYLRVMARYVGLGLLKSPVKKTNKNE